MGIREEFLRRPASPTPGIRPTPSSPRPLPPPNGDNRDDVAERTLVSLMLRVPATAMKNSPATARRANGSAPNGGPLLTRSLPSGKNIGNIDIAQLAQTLPAALASEFAALALEGENLSDSECADGQRLSGVLAAQACQRLERDLRIAIRAAEEQKDEKANRERILEWQDIVRKERQLERQKLEPKITAPIANAKAASDARSTGGKEKHEGGQKAHRSRQRKGLPDV